jgi:hypothetical protein
MVPAITLTNMVKKMLRTVIWRNKKPATENGAGLLVFQERIFSELAKALGPPNSSRQFLAGSDIIRTGTPRLQIFVSR